MRIINCAALPQPGGFSHGVLMAPGGHLLVVAGQTAADVDGRILQREFVAQFDVALSRVVEVVKTAGGVAEHIAGMRIFVTDMDAYLVARPLLADVWRRHMGRYYPAMALVQVTRLVDSDATVEIEATAVIPSPEPGA